MKFFHMNKAHHLSRLHMYKFYCTIICIVLVLTGCNTNNSANPDLTNVDQPETSKISYISKTSFLLNTIVTINIYDKQEDALIEECFDLIKNYEKIYSRTDTQSELFALNHGNLPHNGFTYQISSQLYDLLNHGLYYSKLSEGAFDITIAPITTIWDFSSLSPVIPSDEKIKKALPKVNYENIQLKDNEITLGKEGIGIDLGAIAKGYIADRVKEFLVSNGVKSAMINLGGNVLCVGQKPDGSTFKVGIQKPYADRNETIAIMELSDVSVVSSGIYERFFTLDDVSYHHILNPKTGFPYDNELVSVTIISKSSVDGDGLSTTCYALGLDKGLELIDDLSDTYAVFITKEYEIVYSKGFHEAIKVTLQ